MAISATTKILNSYPIEMRLDFLAELVGKKETSSSAAAAAAAPTADETETTSASAAAPTNVNRQIIIDTVDSIFSELFVLTGKKRSEAKEEITEVAQSLLANRGSFDALSKKSQIDKAKHELEIKKASWRWIQQEKSSLEERFSYLAQKISRSQNLVNSGTYNYHLCREGECTREVQIQKGLLASYRRHAAASLTSLNRAEEALRATQKAIQDCREQIIEGNLAQGEQQQIKLNFSLLDKEATILRADADQLTQKIASLTKSYNQALSASHSN